MHKLSYTRPLWFGQNGTIGADLLKASAMGSQGSVLLVGHTSGNWTGVNAGSHDFAAVKLDSNGNELWRWQVRFLPVIVMDEDSDGSRPN